MADDLILVTGGTGMIGFSTLEAALKSGYRVRAAVRRDTAVEHMKGIPSIQPYLDKLEFAIVPDIAVDGAYNDAIRGATYVFHLASPLATPVEDYNASFFVPAVQGTINVLEAAKTQSSVKRVVIASSAVIFKAMHGDTAVSTPKDVVADSDGPFPHFFVAYQYSKVKAWYATKEWLANNDHNFEVTQLYPSFVLGKNPVVDDLDKLTSEGSSSFLFQMLRGSTVPMEIFGSTVHLDDVTTLFMKAIDPSIAGGQDWVVNSQSTDEKFEWASAKNIVKGRFQQAVHDGILSLDGSFPTAKGTGRLDNSGPTKSIPGFHWKSYEDQVVSVVEQILELKSRKST